MGCMGVGFAGPAMIESEPRRVQFRCARQTRANSLLRRDSSDAAAEQRLLSPSQAGALNGKAGGKDHSGNMFANLAAHAFRRRVPARNASK